MEGKKNNQPFTHVNKRKKRSLIQQVKKKFKKSSSFSRGSYFEADEYQYFVRIFELDRKFDGTLEEKVSFANNALAQTESREVECSFNQLISRVIENLLPLATPEVLERFYNAFSEDLRRVSSHEYASHVLQALMIEAAKHSLEEGNSKTDHSSKSRAWLLKVSKFLLNNFEEFVLDKFCCPTLRTSLYCLSGRPHLDKHFKPQYIENGVKDFSSVTVHEECSLVIDKFFVKCFTLPQFSDLVSNTLSSGFLQVFLSVLKEINKKHYKQLRDKIIQDCFLSKQHSADCSPMDSPVALSVLDLIIEQNVKGNALSVIFNQLICGRLVEMSTANVGNTTVQKLINNCTDPKMIEKIFSVLSPQFSKLIEIKKFGVLVSLCQACERLLTLQTDFFEVLMGALNCDNLPKDKKSHLVMAIATLSPLPYESTTNVNRHGSLIVQSLLSFQKPLKLAKSLLALEPKILVDILSSQYGCHITGAFCKSKTIGMKNKNELIKKLMDNFPSLAQTKFGSRTFDDIWEIAKPEQRFEIVQSLSSCYSQLKSNQYGRFISTKVDLDYLKNEGSEKWRKKSLSQGAYKKMFASIIGD